MMTGRMIIVAAFNVISCFPFIVYLFLRDLFYCSGFISHDSMFFELIIN